jgi:hypothetical protein
VTTGSSVLQRVLDAYCGVVILGLDFLYLGVVKASLCTLFLFERSKEES